MTQGIGPPDLPDPINTTGPTEPTGPTGPTGPDPAPTGRSGITPKRVVVILVAAVALVALLNLASKSTRRDNRRMTPAAGSGMVAVPSVVGVAEERALAALAGQQLTGVVVGTDETCSKPAGAVVNQTPAAMTQAALGATVRLVLAKRTPIPIPEASAETMILPPGGGYEAAGHASRPTRIEFELVGDPCAVGTVTVSHPTAGPEIFELRAGERGSRSVVYGPGTVSLQFTSLDPGARLAVFGAEP